MTAIALDDLTSALLWCIRREAEVAPPECRDYAAEFEALERADVRERAWTAESEDDYYALLKRWNRVYAH